MAFGEIKAAGTMCSMTRYTGSTKGRILNGGGDMMQGGWWLHGHEAGMARAKTQRELAVQRILGEADEQVKTRDIWFYSTVLFFCKWCFLFRNACIRLVF